MMEGETMRPITTLISVTLAVASGGVCSQDEPGKAPTDRSSPPHLWGSFKVGLPPNSWVVTVTNKDGQLMKFLGYRSKAECERNIWWKEYEQHETHGHCDPFEAAPSK